MSIKLLLPTYRARERYIRGALEAISLGGHVGRMLHVGSGEGEVDHWLAPVADHIDSIDINHGDVAVAHAAATHLRHVRYSVQDGERMAFADESFDLAVCLEVIEHAAHPGALLRDIGRVLRPGGHLLLTCPHADFPFTYDPLNSVLQRWGLRLPMGAYGYGHHWLASEAEVTGWAEQAGFDIVAFTPLSHHLVGLAECYLPGLAQKLLKRNSANTGADDFSSDHTPAPSARADHGAPSLVKLTDLLIAVDARLAGVTKSSIGLAWTFRRRG